MRGFGAISAERMKRGIATWLGQGVSPRRLGLTLALGFAIGCIPVVGIPTVLCAGLALALRLNLPAMQAANYAAMPMQLMLIVPFVRMGGWLLAWGPRQAQVAGGLLGLSPAKLAGHMGWLAVQALVAWVLVAAPAVMLMTLTFTRMLRRIPALAEAESCD